MPKYFQKINNVKYITKIFALLFLGFLGLLGFLAISCTKNTIPSDQMSDQEKYQNIENPFLDTNGFVDVSKMTYYQLLIEKAEIEKKNRCKHRLQHSSIFK